MIPALLIAAGTTLAAPTAVDACGRDRQIACGSQATLTLASDTETDLQNSPADDHAHPYVGMWVTADGRIRQELLPNGRYDEARGSRQSAYVGRYEVTGDKIFYWDDSGFTADGEFTDENTLSHGGMTFFRER